MLEGLNHGKLENRPEDLARSEEEVHLSSELLLALCTFLTLKVYFLQIADHGFYIEGTHCFIQMVHEYLVRDTKVAQKQNHLPVEVALTESSASDHLQVVVIAWELSLTGSQLDHLVLVSEGSLDQEHTLGPAEPDLEGAATHEVEFVADSLG